MCTCLFDPNLEEKGDLFGATQAVGTHPGLHKFTCEGAVAGARVAGEEQPMLKRPGF